MNTENQISNNKSSLRSSEDHKEEVTKDMKLEPESEPDYKDYHNKEPGYNPSIKLPGIKQLLTKSEKQENESQTGNGEEKLDDNKNKHKEEDAGFLKAQYEGNNTSMYQKKGQNLGKPIAITSNPSTNFAFLNPPGAGYMPPFSIPPQYPFAQSNAFSQVQPNNNNNQQGPMFYNSQALNQLPNGGLIFSPSGQKTREKVEELNASNADGNMMALSMQQQQQMLQQLSAQQQILHQWRNIVPQQQMMFPIEQKLGHQSYPKEEEDEEEDSGNDSTIGTNSALSNIVERKKKSLKYKKRYICEICAEKAGVIQKRANGEIYFLEFDPRDPKIVNSKHGKSSIPFSFSTSGHLARHSRLHTGVKNHVCPVPLCGKRFGRRDNMRQHYKIHLKKGTETYLGSHDETKPFSVPDLHQNHLGQIQAMKHMAESKNLTLSNSDSNHSSSNSIPVHDFPREAQNMMFFQAQQHYLQQQHFAAAQQQHTLHPQMGVPYQALSMGIFPTNGSIIQGYPYDPSMFSNRNHDINNFEHSLPLNALSEKENKKQEQQKSD